MFVFEFICAYVYMYVCLQVEELRSDVAVSCGRQGPASTLLSREVQLLQTKVRVCVHVCRCTCVRVHVCRCMCVYVCVCYLPQPHLLDIA